MSENLKNIISANKKYMEEFGENSDLGAPPKKKLAVLTCMDCRLDPIKFLGLELGDAHVIRNGGGRASEDAIRSLVASYIHLGTNEFLVIHHSECGFETFTQEQMGALLKEKLDSSEGEFINWLTISDRIESIKNDVMHIRNHPLIEKDISITGLLLDIKTAELTEIISV